MLHLGDQGLVGRVAERQVVDVFHVRRDDDPVFNHLFVSVASRRRRPGSSFLHRVELSTFPCCLVLQDERSFLDSLLVCVVEVLDALHVQGAGVLLGRGGLLRLLLCILQLLLLLVAIIGVLPQLEVAPGARGLRLPIEFLYLPRALLSLLPPELLVAPHSVRVQPGAGLPGGPDRRVRVVAAVRLWVRLGPDPILLVPDDVPDVLGPPPVVVVQPMGRIQGVQLGRFPRDFLVFLPCLRGLFDVRLLLFVYLLALRL
mmetsp:Transcript_118474/g.335897  ORF Transcript_118474/g.335897 Transcript_118474/m.335897 type:complete len:258 (+) Transcript_118474:648-1421(+)